METKNIIELDQQLASEQAQIQKARQALMQLIPGGKSADAAAEQERPKRRMSLSARRRIAAAQRARWAKVRRKAA